MNNLVVERPLSDDMRVREIHKKILAQNKRFKGIYEDTRNPKKKANLKRQLEIYNELLRDIGAEAFQIKLD